MKNWIELNRQGLPQFVNLAHVVQVIKTGDGFAMLSFDDGLIQYDESYDEVVLMIHREGESEQVAMQSTERVGCLEVRETIYAQPAKVDSTGLPHNCNKSIAQLGKATPRTCQACGLGPCKYDKATCNVPHTQD